MLSSLTKKCFNLAAAMLLVGSVGCGGTTSNDQGTSFLAYGFYMIVNDEYVPTSAADVTLQRDTSPTGVDGLSFTRLIGIENRMTSQFIRLVRADCDYFVDGSFIDIPSDSMALSRVLDAAPNPNNPVEPEVGGDESITPNANVHVSRLDLISPDMFAFLNNNRAYLPELPFRMTITCSVTGVTQAGDILTTNPLNYFIHFNEESECCAGAPGFQTGGASGGDLIVANPRATASPTATPATGS